MRKIQLNLLSLMLLLLFTTNIFSASFKPVGLGIYFGTHSEDNKIGIRLDHGELFSRVRLLSSLSARSIDFTLLYHKPYLLSDGTLYLGLGYGTQNIDEFSDKPIYLLLPNLILGYNVKISSHWVIFVEYESVGKEGHYNIMLNSGINWYWNKK